MQDRYTGDIGDFGKYGLLRTLTGAGEGTPEKLGVVWYLTPPEKNGDGRQRDYLKPGNRIGARLRECDEELYRELAGLEAAGDRQVGQVRLRGLLPPGTEYDEELLDPRAVERMPGPRPGISGTRGRWSGPGTVESYSWTRTTGWRRAAWSLAA